jgi:chromosomal replication initiation ATPase DnaA
MENPYQKIYDLEKQNKSLQTKMERMRKMYEDKLAELRHEILNPRIKYTKKLEDWEVVLAEICKVYNVTPAMVISNSRKMEYTAPRHLFCYILRFHYGMKVVAIGRILIKDHTTVLHACKTIEYYLEYDKILQRNYATLLEVLGFNNDKGNLHHNNHSLQRVRSGVL